MNIKKIIFINLIIIVTIYFLAEIAFYMVFCNRIGYKVPFLQIYSNNNLEFYPPARFHPIKLSSNHFSKKPILMIGCSYTEGELLSEDNTPEAKLSKLTGRYVYNWGMTGYGPSAFLASLNREHKNKHLTVNPEYIIYTYMFHHIERFGHSQFYNILRKYDLIPFQKYNFLYNSFIYQYFKNIDIDKYLFNSFDNRYDLCLKNIGLLKKECDLLYPNSKFIILLYSDINNDLNEVIMGENNCNKEIVDKLFEVLYSQEFRTKLEDMGITVISTEELIGRKMYKPEDRIPNDPNHPHPSSTAWDEILPELVKKLNL